jgi:hypothetical protein
VSYEQQPCTREDLRAIVLIESSWGVNSNGAVNLSDWYGEGSGDTDYVDYYKCDACCQTFEPENGAMWPHDQIAWQAALDHLPKQEAA